MLTWHALAKLRMHHDLTITLLRNATIRLGKDLRTFEKVVCPKYNTLDTDREAQAKVRFATKQKKGTKKIKNVATGRKAHPFNIATSKIHALGDYVDEIVRFGTTDGYSTQLGEHEHRRVKARYRLSSKNSATGQLVNRDAYETEMRFKAQMLRECGINPPIDIPGEDNLNNPPGGSILDDVVDDATLNTHYSISKTSRFKHHLPAWLKDNENEIACKGFVGRLKNHCLGRIRRQDVAEEDLNFTDGDRNNIVIDHGYLYEHATINFNFTTYDVKRDSDVLKPFSPKNDKCNIMLPSREDNADGTVHPFWYARVVGIFHVDVSDKSLGLSKHRIDFLWVRWFGQDSQWKAGESHSRLDRIGFVPSGGEDEPFGFVDPNTVIRGCHLIPAFRYQRTHKLLSQSKFREPAGDYVNFYVNKFVNRDIFMRYNGLGVGHVDSSTRAPPSLSKDRDIDVFSDVGEDDIEVVGVDPDEAVEVDSDADVLRDDASSDDDHTDDDYGDEGYFADGGEGGEVGEGYEDDADVRDVDDEPLAEY